MGGDVLAVDVSAKTKANLDKLEEAILLQAEVADLKANPERPAEGAVVEAKIDSGRGAVATVLVSRGTLRVGDVFVAGGEWGRVRALLDNHGRKVDDAGPSVPVEVLGLNGAPEAGDVFLVVDSDARAREIADYRRRKGRILRAEGGEKSTMEEMFARISEGEAGEFPVVVKGDVQGSVEAILGAGKKLSTDEVQVRVTHSGVGAINESDVHLARASGAVIVGFNVRANVQARELANREKVDVRYYSVIYDVIEDFKGVLTGLLAPTIREKELGTAEVLEVFNVTKAGKIAGCRLNDGVMRKGARVRLLRDSVVIHEGSLATLKRFKDDVDEVKAGMECGMSFEKYQDMQVGDVIEAFEVEERSPARCDAGPAVAMTRRTSRPESQRQLRVGEELRHALSSIFTRGEVRDRAVAGKSITVTEVRCSPDLRNATVYVLPLAEPAGPELVEGLRRSAPFLRARVNEAVRLKYSPKLSFELDESFDAAQAVEDVLRRAEVVRDLGPRDGEDDNGAPA